MKRQETRGSFTVSPTIFWIDVSILVFGWWNLKREVNIYLNFFTIHGILAFISYNFWMVDPAVPIHFLKCFNFEQSSLIKDKQSLLSGQDLMEKDTIDTTFFEKLISTFWVTSIGTAFKSQVQLWYRTPQVDFYC